MAFSNETKTRKINHSLWTHLPAVALLLVFIGYLIYSSPLPADAPVHFNFGGEPDRYGSPWQILGMTLAVSVLFIGISILLDELWARQEKKKSFNWFSLLDEMVVGWITGTGIGYLVALNNNADIIDIPWQYGLAFIGGAVVLAVIFEALRPYRPAGRQPEPRDTRELKKSLAQQLKDDTQFVYWESQNPVYVTLLSTLIPLTFIAAAFIVWFIEGWGWSANLFGVGFIIIGIAIMLFTFGGQRLMITRPELSVRWGALGLRVLRLKTTEIASTEFMEFSPLRDFGGYGIRFGRGMKAYYLRGNLGVKVVMTDGKKYLLGSDNPERLVAVLELVAGKN